MVDTVGEQFGGGSPEPDTEAVAEKIRKWVENRRAEWEEGEWLDLVTKLYEDGHAVGMSRKSLEDIRDSEKKAWFRAEEKRKTEERVIAETHLRTAEEAELKQKAAEQARKRRQEEQLFEEVRASPTIQLCKRYLCQYPNGKYPRKVNKALERLQDKRWYYFKLIARVTILCVIVIVVSFLVSVQLIRISEKQAQITHLLTEAQTNDSRENGKVALDALAELFRIDPKHVNAMRLYRKISAYYISSDPSWWFNKAKTTTATIRDLGDKARTYKAIAKAQTDAGDLIGVQETLKALEATAESIKSTDAPTADRDSGSMWLGAAHATAGNITEALTIASRIGTPLQKSYIYNTIVDTQLKEHDFAGARATTELIPTSRDMMKSYWTIALDQLKEGDIAGAKGTAAAAYDNGSIWEHTYKWRAYMYIVRAEAKAGNLAEAKETLKLIKSRNSNDYSNLVSCAALEAELGNTTAARATFEKAKDLVSSSRDIGKADSYCWIAGRLYDALGDEALACRTLNQAKDAVRHGSPRSRAWCYNKIAAVETKMGNMFAAKESFAKAKDAAASCRDGRQKKAELYEVIARKQARVGDIVGAKATAAKIRRAQERAQAYLAIAGGQEEMGDIAAAKKSLWQARAATKRIRGVDNKVFGYLGIAKEQARIGDITSAKTTAARISEAKWKSNAYTYIASVQVEAGDIVGAKVLIKHIKTYEYFQTSVYEKIAKAQAKTGDLVGLYDWINDISHPVLRTFAYLGAWEGLIEKTARQ